MTKRKGQFMVISAILIGLSVLATSTLLHDMQTRPINTVDEGYTLQSVSNDIGSTGEHIEEINQLERSLQHRSGYRANITAWEGESPDYGNITFEGSSAFLEGSIPAKGMNTRFIYNVSIPEPEEDILFTDVSESSPEQNYNFDNTWSLEGSDTNDEEEIEHSFSEAGYYEVSLEASTDAGDTDIEVREIRVGSLPMEVVSTNGPVSFGGEDLEVEVEVENIIGENQSETLEFEVEDDDAGGDVVASDSVDFNLAPWVAEQFTFFWDHSNEGPGDYTVVLSLPDEEKRVDVVVQP